MKKNTSEDTRGVEEIRSGGRTIAIIVRRRFSREGIQFFTPDDFSQQLGYMKHKKGHRIQEHTHNLQIREIEYTQETLFVRKGRLRVDFYADDRALLASRELRSGDVILLASGGHGFEFLEESELIEVKQGPHCGDADKVRFDAGDKS